MPSAQDDDEFADVMPDGDDPDAKEFTASITHGKKPVLFKPFIYKNDDFTKTGSGQT